MNQRQSGLLALLLFTIVTLLHVLSLNNIVSIDDNILFVSRWVFVASLVIFAIFKKSLTTWILVAMAIGVEIGLDFREFSQNLSFLSKIFLRLVKTIVAPLLFCDTGRWHRQPFQPEAGGPHGLEIPTVF
ncbi:MAG: cation:dicarboxylase symporter family transporter [Chitinophagaceae bacterium]|nr:cation:dicarboxylase symporter family transporter [Chitinophagaceae bacterium]